MGFDFSTRLLDPERMDVERLDPATTASILQTLEKVNRWLGGVSATLSHVERFSKTWRPGEHIRFIDWGTGGADIPRALARWGRARGFAFEIIGVDMNRSIVDYARTASSQFPEIQIVQSDWRDYPSPGTPFDYAISSLTLHHLRDDEIIPFLKKSDELTQRGLIMNDLIRDIRAWAWITLLTRVGGAHPVVQHDGPLSVRRAFRRRELEQFAVRANLPYLDVTTHFGYRMTLAGEKITIAKESQPVVPTLNLQASPNAGI